MADVYYHYTSYNGFYQILASGNLILSLKGDYGEGLYLTEKTPDTNDAILLKDLFDLQVNSEDGQERLASLRFYFGVSIHGNTKLEQVRAHQYVYPSDSKGKICIVEAGIRKRSESGKRFIGHEKFSPAAVYHLQARLQKLTRGIELDLQ
jgi:hypothetical protein